MISAAVRALLLSFWLTFTAGEALACMCNTPQTAAENAALVKEIMDGADAVFAGIVVRVTTEPPKPCEDRTPTTMCEDTLFDIWVLEVGKGDVNGVARVALRDNPYGIGWGVGSYAKVVAHKENGELRRRYLFIDCDECPDPVFAFGGPVSPWKISLIYGALLIVVVGAIIFAIIRLMKRAPAPPTS